MHPASVAGSTAASTLRRTSSALHPRALSESGRLHRSEQQRMMSNDHAAGQQGLLAHVRPQGPVPHLSPRPCPPHHMHSNLRETAHAVLQLPITLAARLPVLLPLCAERTPGAMLGGAEEHIGTHGGEQIGSSEQPG